LRQVYKKGLTETESQKKSDQKNTYPNLFLVFLEGVNNFVAILRVEKDQEDRKMKRGLLKKKGVKRGL